MASEYYSAPQKYIIKIVIFLRYAPYGERILINDRKPSGLDMSVAVNAESDVFHEINFSVDNSL